MRTLPQFTSFVLLILAFLFLFSYVSHNWQLPAVQIDAIRKDGTLDFLQADGSVITSINIEIAETSESQAKGLMERELLDFESGMLFVFQDIKPRNFWMHDTPTSLDIIFVGEDYSVVNITRHTTPMSDQSYSSKCPIKYAVEVRAGFTERYTIKKGTKIRWQRSYSQLDI